MVLWRDVAAGGRAFREPLWEQQPACRHQLDQQRQQSSAPLATTGGPTPTDVQRVESWIWTAGGVTGLVSGIPVSGYPCTSGESSVEGRTT